MSTLSDKVKAVGCLGGIKALENIDLRLNKTPSLPSLNVGTDIFSFLLDITKMLVGAVAFKELFINLIISKIPVIDAKLKRALTKCLINTYHCNMRPDIPQYLFDTGVNVEVSKLDFFCFLKVNPNSEVGHIIYDEGEDPNKSLYEAIQTGTSTWKNLLIFEFRQTPGTDTYTKSNNFPNPGWSQNYDSKPNVMNIKIHPDYQNKTLNQFTVDFVNSYAFLNVDNVLLKITDELWGVVTKNQKADKFCIQNKVMLGTMVNKTLNSPDDIFDDSFYNFENDELTNIFEETENLAIGNNMALVGCNQEVNDLDLNSMNVVTNYIRSSKNSSLNDIKIVIDNSINIITNRALRNVPRKDRTANYLKIIEAYIKTFIKVVFSSLFSPKVMLIFVIYDTVVFGQPSYNNLMDFLKKHKNIFNSILKNFIIAVVAIYLVIYIKKRLREIKQVEISKQIKERTTYLRNQILSLLAINTLLDKF